MSTTLNLTVGQFGRMVERGAFDDLNRKIELIRGEIREMNPAGPVHDDYITYLNNWSVRTTLNKAIVVTVQTGLSIPEFDSQPEPDLLWVRAARYLKQHPSPEDVKLAIEVSDSSLQVDLIEKAQLYAQARIVEYWIVDIQGKCVHVFRAPQNGCYTDRSVAKAGEYLGPLEACTTPLDLADLFGS